MTSTWRGKYLFGLYFHVTVPHREESEQKLKAGTTPSPSQCDNPKDGPSLSTILCDWLVSRIQMSQVPSMWEEVLELPSSVRLNNITQFIHESFIKVPRFPNPRPGVQTVCEWVGATGLVYGQVSCSPC